MSDFEKQIHAMFDHIWDCDINHPVFEDTVGELMDAVIQCYNNLPSAQPRKKGKWVGADSQCGIGCPFCGTPVDDFCSSIDYIDLSYEPNFCPNCGADMREGEEG